MTVHSYPTPSHRSAVILLGGLVATWNHRFLHAAARRGLEVLLLDGPASGIDARHERGLRSGPPHPLARIAGHAVHAADDSAGVLEACLAWARDFDVRGVCCLREEYVDSAGLLTDLLGLPSPGLRASRVCRNKYLQRRYLGLWSPASELVGPRDRLARARTWNRFPAVVKPVGRLASSGVRLVLTGGELLACLDDYSPTEVLQFEERIVGPEFSVESLSRDGVALYAEVTEKRTTEGDSPYFVELGHTTPAVHLSEASRASLLATHAAVLERLQFGTGIAHGEYRITGGGRVVLTEVAVRPPGDSIMALHWLATGFALEDAVLGLALGEDVAPPASARRYARQVYLAHHPGVLTAVEVDASVGMDLTWFDIAEVRDQIVSGSADADPPSLRCLLGLKPVGTPLGPLRESADRAAMFVVDAPTPDELDAIEDSVRRGTRLRVMT